MSTETIKELRARVAQLGGALERIVDEIEGDAPDYIPEAATISQVHAIARQALQEQSDE